LAAIVIAARTQAYFAVKHPKNPFWDLDGQSMGYKGEKPSEINPDIEQAIKSTRNMVLSVQGAVEGGTLPFSAQWGPTQGGKDSSVVISRLSLYDAEEMGKKGNDAAEILSRAFPQAHIELIQ
jgi:stage II sporulation protein D